MKYLFAIVMSFVFIFVLIGSNIYLSRRFGWILSIENLKYLHILFAIVPIYMLSGLIGFSNATSKIGSILYGGAAILTGVMLYLLLSFLFFDLLQLLIRLQPRVFGLGAILLTLLISVYGLWNATNTKLCTYEVPIAGLKEEVRIIHLSDLHVGHFRGRKYMEKLVGMSLRQEPDLVAITGDYFDGKIQLKKENVEPLQRFKVPVYFVEGNHDGYSGVQEIKNMLREAGVIVMENEVVQHGELQLIGLNHMQADGESHSIPPNPTEKSIKSVLSNLMIEQNKPCVLLHHSPDGVKFANEHGVDLFLAGHTHAGQLFPVNFLNDILFRYNKGLGQLGSTKVFVSQGSGTFGPPMRIGTKSEIALLKLLPLSD